MYILYYFKPKSNPRKRKFFVVRAKDNGNDWFRFNFSANMLGSDDKALLEKKRDKLNTDIKNGTETNGIMLPY